MPQDPQKAVRVLVTGSTGFLGRNVLQALMLRPEVEVVASCRSPSRLPGEFKGEIRAGDLLDGDYRRRLFDGIDVVCHAGGWSSLWSHEQLEKTRFFEPSCDLIDRAIECRVRRFVQAGTIVMAGPPADGALLQEVAEPKHTGFWPHLDRLVDLENFMRGQSHRGTQMVSMRLGHFVGRGNALGLVSALAPRLRTHLVPWLAGGRSRLPLVADTDLGESFALAALADGLGDFESFNICGPEFPSAREVIGFIAGETGFPAPVYSVPYAGGYSFAWLMEKLHPLLPGISPCLTRSIVYLCEDWPCSTEYAGSKLGFSPRKDWRLAVKEALSELKAEGFPGPAFAQAN